jgi:hypothetical protein
MKTETIEDVEVTVIENLNDMLQILKENEIPQYTVPMIFNIKCGNITVTTTSGF